MEFKARRQWLPFFYNLFYVKQENPQPSCSQCLRWSGMEHFFYFCHSNTLYCVLQVEPQTSIDNTDSTLIHCQTTLSITKVMSILFYLWRWTGKKKQPFFFFFYLQPFSLHMFPFEMPVPLGSLKGLFHPQGSQHLKILLKHLCPLAFFNQYVIMKRDHFLLPFCNWLDCNEMDEKN